jgi:hypothetical protein
VIGDDNDVLGIPDNGPIVESELVAIGAGVGPEDCARELE